MAEVPVNVNTANTAARNTGVPPSTAGRKERKPRKPLKMKLIALIVGVVVLVLLVLGGWMMYKSSSSAAIDGDKYQAVFFTNGQVYFGKLHKLGGSYYKLTDIFYIQAKPEDGNDDSKSQNPQQTSQQTASDLQLIKLGSEVHGPEDEMVISKEQILFFENLKKDGKVSDTIKRYHDKN